MGSIHRYELIKEGDDIKEEPQHTITPVTTSWWKILLCNLLAASAGAAVMFLLAPRFSSTPHTSSAVSSSTASTTSSPGLVVPTPSLEHEYNEAISPNMLVGTILDCGGNPSEARAKGCIYDVMMQDWVPEPCYDSVLTERYLANHNWTMKLYRMKRCAKVNTVSHGCHQTITSLIASSLG